MQTINYDYPALKDAHGKFVATVEAFEANAKTLSQTGTELVEGNNAEGVKSTMTAFQEKQEAVLKVMTSSLEQVTAVLAVAKELHLANGGHE